MADREVVQDEEEVILDLGGNEDMDLIQFFIDNKNKKIIPRYPDSYCPSFEDNNTTKVDQDEKSNPYEINLSTPKENYKTILKWAVIPETGIPKFVFNYRSIFYLLYIV
ncbi:uncharacterized protein LOC100571223 isoform X2 [Acyrthosiphon pisum]|uniref:Uncharacterized protein n=1 Tax=Acyrthosiphon pisum TaxID=7029 RepID=A0A8R2JXI1_ACYPI|nr:uncharacterized protein LOC100571223 isoform X2 [Acyrthosiphon pisum]